MKKIAIITSAVALPGEKGYSRFHFLAELLNDKGYEVDIITSTFQHWEKKQRIPKKKYSDKYDVHFAKQMSYAKNVDLRRLLSYIGFSNNVLKILRREKYDLIYCIIPDNHTAAKVAKYGNIKRIPVIIDIEDLWPEAMEMLVHNKVFRKILFKPFRMEAKIAYCNAIGFIGTSDEYRDFPKKYGIISENMNETVYVGCDLDEFDRGVERFSETVKKDAREFWVTYAGNLGTSYDIPTLIYAAQKIEKDEIKIKILGGGPLEKHFKEIAREKSCNVEFVGYVPYEKMAAYLVKSDIVINSFVKNAPQSIVTKIGDYLASGKAMINTCSSIEFRNKVEKDGFGVNIEAENADVLKETILELFYDTELREKMGEKARKIAEKEFDRKNSYMKIVDMIKRIFGENNEKND